MSAIQTGLIQGKLSGMKVGSDWPLFYVELYDTSLRIFEGNEDPTRPRRQIRTLEINSTDLAYNKDRDRKRDYRFQYERCDGKSVFKCTTPEERSLWVSNLSKMIQRKHYSEKGLLPTTDTMYSQASHVSTAPFTSDTFNSTSPASSPRINKVNNSTSYTRHSVDSTTPPPPPPHKRDSGFVSGTGDARTYNRGETPACYSGDSVVSHGKSNSGDSAIVHSTSVIVEHVTGCHSDDGKFTRRTNNTPSQQSPNLSSIRVDEDELERYDWYWGKMTRDECTTSLKEKGKVGNFVVRKNDRGDFVMTFWRKDNVHHHRILQSGGSFQFEKSVVQAAGESIPDLLDTYMKCCTDKTIGPYGGQLYPTYDDPWNPPDIDFDKMSKHLQKVKQVNKKPLFKAGPGMGDHTYGGLTLDQMNEVISEGAGRKDIAPNSPPTQAKPTALPGLTPSTKPTKKPPAKSPKPGGMKGGVAIPFLNPAAGPSKGYVNVMPQQPKQQEEEFSDDDQEVYIAPGNIGDQEEEEEGDANDPPLYENTVFKQQDETPQQQSVDDSNLYQNFVVNPQQARAKVSSATLPSPRTQNPPNLYANVTFNGKPLTQPRQKNRERRKT